MARERLQNLFSFLKRSASKLRGSPADDDTSETSSDTDTTSSQLHSYEDSRSALLENNYFYSQPACAAVAAAAADIPRTALTRTAAAVVETSPPHPTGPLPPPEIRLHNLRANMILQQLGLAALRAQRRHSRGHDEEDDEAVAYHLMQERSHQELLARLVHQLRALEDEIPHNRSRFRRQQLLQRRLLRQLHRQQQRERQQRNERRRSANSGSLRELGSSIRSGKWTFDEGGGCTWDSNDGDLRGQGCARSISRGSKLRLLSRRRRSTAATTAELLENSTRSSITTQNSYVYSTSRRYSTSSRELQRAHLERQKSRLRLQARYLQQQQRRRRQQREQCVRRQRSEHIDGSDPQRVFQTQQQQQQEGCRVQQQPQREKRQPQPEEQQQQQQRESREQQQQQRESREPQQQRGARQQGRFSAQTGNPRYRSVRRVTPQGYSVTQRRRSPEHYWFREQNQRAVASQQTYAQQRNAIWWQQRQQQKFAEQQRERRRCHSVPGQHPRSVPQPRPAVNRELQRQTRGADKKEKEQQQQQGEEGGASNVQQQQRKRPSLQLQRLFHWPRRRSERRSSSSNREQQQQSQTGERRRSWLPQFRSVEKKEDKAEKPPEQETREGRGRGRWRRSERSSSEQQQRKPESEEQRSVERQERCPEQEEQELDSRSREQGSQFGEQQARTLEQETQQLLDCLDELYTSEERSEAGETEVSSWSETDIREAAEALWRDEEVYSSLLFLVKLDSDLAGGLSTNGQMMPTSSSASASSRRAAAWHQLAARDEDWSPSLSSATRGGQDLQERTGSTIDAGTPFACSLWPSRGAAVTRACRGFAPQVDALRRRLAAAAQQEEWQQEAWRQEPQQHCWQQELQQEEWQLVEGGEIQRSHCERWQQKQTLREHSQQGLRHRQESQREGKPLPQGERVISLHGEDEKGQLQQRAPRQRLPAERGGVAERRLAGQQRRQQLLRRRTRSAEELQGRRTRSLGASRQRRTKLQRVAVGKGQKAAAAATEQQHPTKAEKDTTSGAAQLSSLLRLPPRGPQARVREGHTQSPGRRFSVQYSACVVRDTQQQQQKQEDEAGGQRNVASGHGDPRADVEACEESWTEQQGEGKRPQKGQQQPHWREYFEYEKRCGQQERDGQQPGDEQHERRWSTYSSQQSPSMLVGRTTDESQLSSSHEEEAGSQLRTGTGAAGVGLAAGAAARLREAADGVAASRAAGDVTGTATSAYAAADAAAAGAEGRSAGQRMAHRVPDFLFRRRGAQKKSGVTGADARSSSFGSSGSVSSSSSGTSSSGSSGSSVNSSSSSVSSSSGASSSSGSGDGRGSTLQERERATSSSGGRRSWNTGGESSRIDGSGCNSWSSSGHSTGVGVSGGYGDLGKGVGRDGFVGFERRRNTNDNSGPGACSSCSGSGVWSSCSSGSGAWSSFSGSSGPRTWSEELIVSGSAWTRALMEEQQQHAAGARGADLEETQGKKRWLTGLLHEDACDEWSGSSSSEGSSSDSSEERCGKNEAPLTPTPAGPRASAVAPATTEEPETEPQEAGPRAAGATEEPEAAAAGESEEEESAAAKAEAAVLEQMYDDSADERDEVWVRRHLRVGDKETDGMLACPGCFTPVCYQCRRDELAFSLYRAVAASNVDIDSIQLQQLCGGGGGRAAPATATHEDEEAGGMRSWTTSLLHEQQRQLQEEVWMRLQRTLQQHAANQEQQEKRAWEEQQLELQEEEDEEESRRRHWEMMQQEDERQQQEQQLQEENRQRGGWRGRWCSPQKKVVTRGGESALDFKERIQCEGKEEVEQQRRREVELQQPCQEQETEGERRTSHQEHLQEEQQQPMDDEQQKRGPDGPKRRQRADISIMRHLRSLVSPLGRRSAERRDARVERGRSYLKGMFEGEKRRLWRRSNRRSSSTSSRGCSRRGSSRTASPTSGAGGAGGTGEVLVSTVELSSSSSCSRSNSHRNHSNTREMLELLEEPGVAAAVAASGPEGESPRLHAVRCCECSTTLGLFEARSGIYHFFRVLPGEA